MNETNNFNSTLSTSNENDFIDIISSPLFYGSTIIFIILILCILSFITFLKNKPKLLFSTNL